MKEKCHVFICIHALCDVYLDFLIEQEKISNYKIIEFYSKEIVFNPCKTSYIYTNKFEYFKKLNEYDIYIKELRKQNKQLIFYIVHPFHMITNKIYFFPEFNDEVRLIPDGIANYFNVTTRNFLGDMILKKIFSIFLGREYKVYFDHITAIKYDKYNMYYSLYQEGFYHHENRKLKLLNLNKKNTLDERYILADTLILGKPYSNSSVYFEMMKLILENEIFFSNKKVYYKLHPAEIKSSELEEFLRHFNIEIFNSDRPIEKESIKFKNIIGPSTSALINIKILNPEINCIAFTQLKYLSRLYKYTKNQNMELTDAFKKVGIEII